MIVSVDALSDGDVKRGGLDVGPNPMSPFDVADDDDDDDDVKLLLLLLLLVLAVSVDVWIS